MFDTILDLFSSEENIMFRKMKKEIMSLPVHKFTTDTELVRVKDRDGFITFYAILIKDEYIFYMEKDFLNEFGEGKLWVPFSYFTHENNITLKYSNQHDEELTLFLEKKNERINAISI